MSKLSGRSMRRRIAYALMETGGKLLPRPERQILAKAIKQTIRATHETNTIPAPKVRKDL